MKTIIILLSLLLLTSCTQYRYDVTYEKCNWYTGSYTEIRLMPPHYYWRDRELTTQNWIINNVCDFSFTTTEIWK